VSKSADIQSTIASIYNSASPAVVEITINQQATSFFSGVTETGSGFLIDTQGHILTNNHVIDGASNVQVTLANGTNLTAKILGTDSFNDLAIIGVEPALVSGIAPLQFGDSSTVQPGDTAIAIGSPYGLMNSITAGIISGLDRSVSGSSLTGLLQTDAAINPGNSGGPLLNINGLVIGINTAIENSSDGGIGFAIQSNIAQRVLASLVAGQTVVRPWLGISGTDINAANAAQYGVSVNQGVYVVSVVSNSPAEKTGLKAARTDINGAPTTGGDIIVAIDGQTVTGISQLSAYISSKNVGDAVNLTILRAGQNIDVQVTLQAWPSAINSTNPYTAPFPGLPYGNHQNQSN
jgi:S1-C subfamily serine protease